MLLSNVLALSQFLFFSNLVRQVTRLSYVHSTDKDDIETVGTVPRPHCRPSDFYPVPFPHFHIVSWPTLEGDHLPLGRMMLSGPISDPGENMIPFITLIQISGSLPEFTKEEK